MFIVKTYGHVEQECKLTINAVLAFISSGTALTKMKA
jgi:anaerobic ribonucleoside-triphosphate reductase